MPHAPGEPSPFRIPPPSKGALASRLFALASPIIERVLALDRLGRRYASMPDRSAGAQFVERALEALEIRWTIAAGEHASIPEAGPLVVVCNHPLGGPDGLVLLSLLSRRRGDVKLLANRLLERVPELRDTLISVDVFGGAGASRRNADAMRTAIRWVSSGGCLAVFPAGEVSRLDVSSRRIVDPPWSPALGRILLRSGASALTLFFEGRNGPLFQLAGLVHPLLRTALLPREMLRRARSTVQVRIGQVIPASRLERFEDATDLTAYLRARTYVLGACERSGGKRGAGVPNRPNPVAAREVTAGARSTKGGASGSERGPGQPIVEPEPAALLEAEMAALPDAQVLLESGDRSVVWARAAQIPHTLREIGRLREIAFRAVGEGTGRALDLDRFDAHYLHLFIWDRSASEVLGAYRLGPTDEILPRLGPEGLYTSTLFRYRSPLLAQLDPALELGRSFVRPEQQRSHSALALLWKGIGRFAVLNPRYRFLFGPVSISNDYRSMSRTLLVRFLKMNRYAADLGRLIRPRNRTDVDPRTSWDPLLASSVVAELDQVDDLISDLEQDRRGVPVLLRQYLKLNGILLGFNVDPEFGDVLDGLMLVDLTRVDRPILNRFLGAEGARSFLAAPRG